MAAKKESVNLLAVLSDFKDLKGVDMNTLKNLLEESFRSVIAKIYGTDENYDVIINPQTNDFEIYRYRRVVEDGAVENAMQEIALSQAREIMDDVELDEEISEKIELSEFGRREVLILRQTLASKILEIQKSALYERFKEREGQIVRGEVHQIFKHELLVMDEDGNEMVLPKANLIPTDNFHKGDNYHKGDAICAVIDRVDNQNNNPKIYLSRTSVVFLQRLFERDIPEVEQGLITIKRIARVPGERAKVAVESYDDRIDPVGACVGPKGVRITGIVRELRNESIDVINFTNNTSLLISRALNPARVSRIEMDLEQKKADVYINPDDISLAIGRKGNNIKLATDLSGYTIDIYRDVPKEQEDDVLLDEFNDEIEMWIIDELKRIGCDTAKEVLRMERADLLARTDLEEETIDQIIDILKAEFEE